MSSSVNSQRHRTGNRNITSSLPSIVLLSHVLLDELSTAPHCNRNITSSLPSVFLLSHVLLDELSTVPHWQQNCYLSLTIYCTPLSSIILLGKTAPVTELLPLPYHLLHSSETWQDIEQTLASPVRSAPRRSNASPKQCTLTHVPCRMPLGRPNKGTAQTDKEKGIPVYVCWKLDLDRFRLLWGQLGPSRAIARPLAKQHPRGESLSSRGWQSLHSFCTVAVKWADA